MFTGLFTRLAIVGLLLLALPNNLLVSTYQNAHAISLHDAVQSALKNSDQLRAADFKLHKNKNEFNASLMLWLPRINFNSGYHFFQDTSKTGINERLVSHAKRVIEWANDSVPQFINQFIKSNNQQQESNILTILAKTEPFFQDIYTTGKTFVEILQQAYIQFLHPEYDESLWDIESVSVIPDSKCLLSVVYICAVEMEHVRDLLREAIDRDNIARMLFAVHHVVTSFHQPNLRAPVESIYKAADKLLSLNTPEELDILSKDLQSILQSLDNYLTQTLVASQSKTIQASLSLQWNLFRGGLDTITMQSRRLDYKKSAVMVDQAAREVIYAAIEAYVELYFVKYSLSIAKENLALAKKWFQSIEERFESGMISSLELSEAELMFLNAEKLVRELSTSMISVEAKYIDVIGTVHTDLEAPIIPAIPYLEDTQIPTDINKNNPEIMLARYDVELSKNNSYASMVKLAPTVDVEVQYVRNMKAMDLKKIYDHWLGSVNVNFNLLNAGQDIRDIYNNHIERKIAYLKLNQTYKDTHAKVIDHILEIQKLRLDSQFQHKNLKYINQKIRKIEIQIENGVMAIESLVDTFSKLLEAEMRRIEIDKLFILKSYKLLQDTGTLSLSDLF